MFSVCALAGGMYYLMPSEKKVEITQVVVEPEVEQLAMSDDKLIWQTTEGDEEETAADSSSALPDDIRESKDDTDEKGAVEDTSWFKKSFDKAKETDVSDKEAEENSEGKEEEVSFWGSLGKIGKVSDEAEEEQADESSSAYQESLNVLPHKKDMHWLKQVLNDEEDESEGMLDEGDEDHQDAAVIEETADTVSPQITD